MAARSRSSSRRRAKRGLFEAALGAFAELVGAGEDGEPVVREVELAADDHALLLVDWLSELVFLAEVEQFVPERLAAFELSDEPVARDRAKAGAATRATW